MEKNHIFLHIPLLKVSTTGIEPAPLSGPAPQAGVATSYTTWTFVPLVGVEPTRLLYSALVSKTSMCYQFHHRGICS